MQNLILDFGNTLNKLAVFENGNLLVKFSGNKLQVENIEELKIQYPKLNRVIYSTVIEIDVELIEYLKTKFISFELTHQTPIPLVNEYKTPETLGKDRLAAAIGAFLMFPNKNILVVDAGSTITYELITKGGNYLGGGISPGINMRFKALNKFTGKLPLIKPIEYRAKLIGQNTNESILSGVINGIIAEVDGIIDQYKKKYPDILIIFTGGDLKYFDKNLKNNIFAAENLVLQGLNFILEYNDNKTA